MSVVNETNYIETNCLHKSNQNGIAVGGAFPVCILPAATCA